MRTQERRFGVECWYLRALRRAGRVHAAEAGRCVLGSDAVGWNAGIYKRCGERGACMQRSDALRWNARIYEGKAASEERERYERMAPSGIGPET